MVQSVLKTPRNWIPFIGLIALCALFLKLPEASRLFAISSCKTCSETTPYIPLVGSAYFALLIAIALLFPNFPSKPIARGGVIWALLLLISLTYLNLPNWCVLCLIAHFCNVLIFTIWLFASPKTKEVSKLSGKERLFLLLMAPILLVALFSSLNLTVWVYGVKQNHTLFNVSLKPGDSLPLFHAKANDGTSIAIDQTKNVLINFISADCTFCKEQLEVFRSLEKLVNKRSVQLINITPALTQELMQRLSFAEWVEDKEGKLRALFKVVGYPTLFVVENHKIAQVIQGVPDRLKSTLSAIIAENSDSPLPEKPDHLNYDSIDIF